MKKLFLLLLLSLGFIGLSNADFQYAVDTYYKEDYKTALKEFKVLAEQGNAKAQIYLSEMYKYGKVGVDKDEELAKSWEIKSAQGGDAYSQYYLGQNIIDYGALTKDDEEAIKWITKAAEQGHVSAIADLEAIGINVEVTADDNKTDTANNDSETLLSFKNTIEAGSGLSSKRIGKWFIGSDCNNITSEIIVLHDQIMQRPFSTEQTLNVLIETNNEYSSKYFPLSDYGDLFFFSDNIIFNSNHSSIIQDYYFELVKFPELSSNDAYQPTQLLSCKNLNNDLGYILLESDAIEFDKFLYSAKNKCQNNKPIDCLRKFVDFADASNNNELSRAELTRFSRFVVKWLTLKGELQLNERMGAAAASMIFAPALAEFILLNYDYDDDDHIDIREMTFDMVNITGSSELNNKIIRGYIEAIDILSKSKKDASRMLEDLF